MSRKFTNGIPCPGSDVILELLRAEHEQVKQRTDIIKQLIAFNCSTKNDAGKMSSKAVQGDHSFKNRKESVIKHNQTSSMVDIARELESMKQILFNRNNQSSYNNRSYRHAKCFLSLHDTSYDPLADRNKINYSCSRLSKETRSVLSREQGKSKLPHYSQLHFDDTKALGPSPTYSQFQREMGLHQSTPKKGKSPNDSGPKTSVSSKTAKVPKIPSLSTFIDHSTIANQTDDPRPNGYDYKLETHRLIQEVTELKKSTKRYEDEKSDWVNEKRRQINILQQLRDASCDETKAAMKLTSWKAADIECNPVKYEESKRTWLLCKKNQIELLEKLRGVSLSEIKKGIERISKPDFNSLDFEVDEGRCQSMMDFNSGPQPQGHELFNSDKVSVRICEPQIKSECVDKDKININIMMKSNSNTFTVQPSSKESFQTSIKGGPSLNKAITTNNSSISIKGNQYINDNVPPGQMSKCLNMPQDEQKQHIEKKYTPLSQSTVTKGSSSNESILDMKNTIIQSLGPRLFQNTYDILSKLNCPHLIIKSANGDATDAEKVLNYILEERKFSYTPKQT